MMSAVLGWTLLLGTLAAAQDDPGSGRGILVKVLEIRPGKADVRVGETFRVAFDLEIPEGFHIYPAGKSLFLKKPTAFAFEGAEAAGRAGEPEPLHYKDEFDEYDYHKGKVTIDVPVRLKPGTGSGPFKVAGEVSYELCSDELCIATKTPFSFEVTVLEGEVEPVPAADPEYEDRGFLGLIFLGMLGGLVSLVMPCTYPLIPITITYFIKQGAGSRAHGLLLSGVYSLGIILSFTGIGFLMTLLLGAGGPTIFAASPWVNVAVGLLFLWFAGSLFGWYEIRLPFGLGSRLIGGQRRGTGGAFILGLLFSVVTFTCTIPIAATILAMAAGQHRFAALLAMVAYSVTMALPFFLMGLFPAAIREVPRSGGWLNTVKTTMAFVELGLAVFYFSKADQVKELNLLNRWVVMGIWVAVAAVTVLYLLDFFRSRPRVLRAAAAAVFLLFGGTMATGFGGKTLGLLEIILPPPPIHGTTLEAGLEEARKQGKPLFAEFTGLTCTNCMANRGTILVDPRVRKLLERYVVAELWTDRDRPMDRENRRTLDEKFGPALPLYVIFTAEGKEIARIGGRPSTEAFLEFLGKGLPAEGGASVRPVQTLVLE